MDGRVTVFGSSRLRKSLPLACCIAVLALLLTPALPVPAMAAGSRLGEFLPQVQPAELIPGADRFGPVEGSPPAAKLFKGDVLLGYAYLNADLVDSTGYSGKPINVLVGLTTDA